MSGLGTHSADTYPDCVHRLLLAERETAERLAAEGLANTILTHLTYVPRTQMVFDDLVEIILGAKG